MVSTRKIEKRLRGRNYNQSLLRKLRKEGKVNKKLENLINQITLEDLISIKLELAAETVNGKLFGFPIFKAVKQITKEAMVNFALSSTSSHRKAASLLGLSLSELKRYIKKYEINTFLD